MISLLFFFVILFLVVQDEETGAWYQHKGRDFKVPLVNGQKKGSTKWPGCRNCYLCHVLDFVCVIYEDSFLSIVTFIHILP